MKEARIARPTPQRPNVASRAETLNEWLAKFHKFDLTRPYFCREDRTINEDGTFAIELVYTQDDIGLTHKQLAQAENARLSEKA